MRGVAALMVALFHIGLIQFTDAQGNQRRLVAGIGSAGDSYLDMAFRILGNGPGAVILFFILSGFVLTKVLDDGPASPVANGSSFLTGRIFRIFPGVIAALCIYALISLVPGYFVTGPSNYTIQNFLKNAALVEPVILGVTWSLQLEMIAAPLLLIIFFLWLRIGRQAWVLPYVILVGLSFTSTWNHLIGQPNSFGQIFAFLSGMAGYLHGRKIVTELKYPGAALTIAIICFLTARPLIGWSSYWTIWVETLFGGAAITLLAFGRFSLRHTTVLSFVGKISFSFYLLHPLTCAAISASPAFHSLATSGKISPLSLCAAAFILSSVAVSPLAWLQYRFIEVPMIKIGKTIRFNQMNPQRVMAAQPQHTR